MVGVDDLGRAVLGQRLLDHFLVMDRFERDGHPMRQHTAAGHVHYRREIHEDARHRNARRVQRPHLVGSLDGQLAQQVGVDLVARARLLVPACGASALMPMRCISVVMCRRPTCTPWRCSWSRSMRAPMKGCSNAARRCDASAPGRPRSPIAVVTRWHCPPHIHPRPACAGAPDRSRKRPGSSAGVARACPTNWLPWPALRSGCASRARHFAPTPYCLPTAGCRESDGKEIPRAFLSTFCQHCNSRNGPRSSFLKIGS